MGRNRDVATAVSLMRTALALLDRADERDAACHLQQALDTARGVPVPCTVEEADTQLDAPEAKAILSRFWSDEGQQ